MSALEHNPPAFPVELGYNLEPGEAHQTGERIAQFPGMTLRDWFAGQVLVAAASAPHGGNGDSDALARAIAAACYNVADAMLAARAASFNDRGQS